MRVRAEGPRGVTYLRIERLHRLHRAGQGESLVASRLSLSLTRVPTQRNTSVTSTLKLACRLHHALCNRAMPFKMAGPVFPDVSRYASRGGRRVTSHLSSARSVRQGEASIYGRYRSSLVIDKMLSKTDDLMEVWPVFIVESYI